MSLNRLTSRLTTLHTVLVARSGHVVLDASFHGESSRARHILNSCTKSVLAAIVGVAVERGLLKITDPVLRYFPSRHIGEGDSGWKRMTLHHLLSMSSGISWPQYGPANVSDAMGRSDNWVEFILKRPLEGEPGTIVNYSNGDSHLVSAILQPWNMRLRCFLNRWE
jgi:CubicO group peptidase (beta-lactamase class C family)